MTNTIEIENLNISDLDIPTDETLQEVATACENIATSSEGIVTSCDNIASSCGDIAKDTTLQSTNTALGSLATDATLQATNTALGGLNTSLGGIIKDATGQSIDTSVGNISTVLSDVATDTTLATVAKDNTLQATNTALSSLMADTTGQSIASAISGLGATLGSDKANISGDNIANPSTFRQNIGVNYVDISNQISVFNNRITISVLRAYKYSNSKIEIYVKGNIATNLSSGQTTIMTIPLSLIYGFDTFSGTASLNSNVITVSTAGTSTTGYIDLNHSGANSGDRLSFFISWFI